MNEQGHQELNIAGEHDIVLARNLVRQTATSIGFGFTDVTRIVTAASELARNAFRYAGGGVMRWRELEANGRAGIELTFEDQGPGIPDIELAMQVGFTTSGGLGQGLPGVKRLMNELEIRSEVGKGTVVTVRKWRNR
jgi:serine/threonine-protein kinase RsbT